MVTVNIYEFSTGIEPERDRDGNWLSKGYTGRYMNATLPGEKVPDALDRAIANKLFAAVVPPGNTPALVGRQVPDKNSSGWSAIAVVSRGFDDKGRALMASRYFCCEGKENLWAVLVVLEQIKRDRGCFPEFDPWLAEEERIGGEFEIESVESECQATLVWSIADFSELNLQEFHALAESKAAARDVPTAWAVGIQSLEVPRSFVFVLAVNAKVKEYLLQKTKIPKAAKVKSVTRRLVYSEAKQETIADFLELLQEGVSDRTWHYFFEEEGATNAIKQNFFTPEMARLLTLRAMLIPETGLSFVEWIDREGAWHLWRDSLVLQESLVAATRKFDSTLWDNRAVSKLARTKNLLVREHQKRQKRNRVATRPTRRLRSESNSYWGQRRDDLRHGWDRQMLRSLPAIFQAIAECQQRNQQNYIQPEIIGLLTLFTLFVVTLLTLVGKPAFFRNGDRLPVFGCGNNPSQQSLLSNSDLIAANTSDPLRQKTRENFKQLWESNPGKKGDEAEQAIWRKAIIISLCGNTDSDIDVEEGYMNFLAKEKANQQEWEQLVTDILRYQTSKQELVVNGVMDKNTTLLLREDSMVIAKSLTGLHNFKEREIVSRVVGTIVEDMQQQYPDNLDAILKITPEIFPELFQSDERKNERTLRFLVILEVKKILGVSASYGEGIIEGDWDENKGFAPLKRAISEWSEKLNQYAKEKEALTSTSKIIAGKLERRLQEDLKSQVSQLIALQSYEVYSRTKTALSEIAYGVDSRIESNSQLRSVWRRDFSRTRTETILEEIKAELNMPLESDREIWIQAIYDYQKANGLSPDGIILLLDENGNPSKTASLLIDRVTQRLERDLEYLQQQQQQQSLPDSGD